MRAVDGMVLLSHPRLDWTAIFTNATISTIRVIRGRTEGSQPATMFGSARAPRPHTRSKEHVPTPHDERPDEKGVTAARLLDIIWANLVDMLGTAAAATVLKRAVKRACVRSPEFEGVTVVREGWEYRCSPPEAWHDQHPSETPTFITLVQDDLFPILRELTGPIVVQRLESVPELDVLKLLGDK